MSTEVIAQAGAHADVCRRHPHSLKLIAVETPTPGRINITVVLDDMRAVGVSLRLGEGPYEIAQALRHLADMVVSM